MTIYNPDGGIILDAPVTTEAVEKFTLMGDWYVLLPFMSLSALDIPEGSYITYKGKKWEIMSPVYPESSGAGYKYSLQFDDQQNKLKKSICFWLGGPNPEAVFSDTTDLTSFGNLIVANMNRELGSEVWEFGGLENVDNQETVKVVSFSGDTCWDAVNNIANAFDCEWWTEQNGGKVYLLFGKLERGSGEIFKEGDVVSQMPARKSNNDDGYGTRFYVFGSTRNLTSDYGQADQGGATNHVSEIRLRLPNNQQYIDARPDLTPSEVTPVVVFFDDVYPKNTDTVTSVDEKTITPEEGDPYPAYVVYAGATPFVPSDVIEDDSFQIQFTSGELTGLTFEVAINYDPETWKPEDGFDKKFEIVAQIETSGDSVSIIPNANMKPKPGDTFVLTGVKLPEQRIAEAEQELLEVGTEYAEKHSGDTNVYDCPTNPVYCTENEKNYDAGQVVILQDARFGQDGRRSRIQGYEKKLYNEYVATYTVGDNRAYSRTGKIENDVKQNIYSQRIGTTTSGAAVYLITRYDQTPASDSNAYSALRALWQFANKQTDETFKGNVAFEKSIASTNYREGEFAGSGFRIGKNANGDYELVIDRIVARKDAVFNEVVINQVTFQIGATVFSNGGCKITRVEELDDVYRCYYDNAGGKRYSGFVQYDQARCQIYDPTQHTIVKYYWRLVMAVGDDYVDLSKIFVDGGGIPEVGDEIAQFGNRTDKTRQSATIIDPQDGSSVVVYSQLDSFSLSKKNYVGLGTNPQTGRAYLFCYGDFFLGDRELKDQFLTFQIPEGQTVPQLFAKMNISLGSGSSGLTNLSEWAEKQQQLDDAAKNAQAAKTTAETANKNAEAARKSAQSAATELEIIQSDEYVSAVEKRSLKLRQADMQAEYPQIVAEAEKYGLAKVEGPFQSTPEYWEQGSANSQYTGYLWDDMKFESTKDIRTQMLLYAFAKAKFSVGTGFMIQAVCFGEDMRSISRTGAAQSITITDENTAFVSLIISKTSDADIAPEELADAALTVGVESSGGGTDPDAITDAANWEQGTIEGKEGQSYADDKYGTMSYMVRSKILIDTPVGSTVSIRGPYQFRLTYYDADGLCTGLTDYWPMEGDVTHGHSIVAKDYPYMAVVIRKLNSAGTSTVDLTPSDIVSSGFTLGDGSSGGGEVPPSADDIQPVEQPSTDHVTGFEKAYNAANAALTKYTASTPENIPTESDFGDIYGYYTARQIILDAIADAVKAHFDTLSDYEYLKEVFPNMVLDSNGVFLSRLMAVKDSAEADAAVVAGMYGGGVETLNNDGFRDPTHGTLMFFAGATDLRNVAKALYQVYEDGFFACENASIAGVIRAKTMYTPFVQPDITQGMVLDPLVYGCNLIVSNDIGSNITYVSLPQGDAYNGMVVRIYEPFITRSARDTAIRGAFAVPGNMGSYSQMTPNMNCIVELTNIGGSQWVVSNPELCTLQ